MINGNTKMIEKQMVFSTFYKYIVRQQHKNDWKTHGFSTFLKFIVSQEHKKNNEKQSFFSLV